MNPEPALRPAVHGLDLDPQTRCAHWHTPLDVVALKFRCCERYYACRECHDAIADHPARLWPAAERDRPAVMCGVCGGELTVTEYLGCGDRCPRCGAGFNPGCRKHHHLYFEPGLDPSGGGALERVDPVSETACPPSCPS